MKANGGLQADLGAPRLPFKPRRPSRVEKHMPRLVFPFLLLVSFMVPLFAGLACPARAEPLREGEAYVNDELANEALRLDTEIVKTAGALVARPSAELRTLAQQAIARKDFAAAQSALAALIAKNPKESSAWLGYARFVNATGTTYEAKQAATAAAYRGYLRASRKADRAGALVLLAEFFAERQLWRPALDAYKASLALVENAPVRQVYTDLREKYGFRVLDYKVDNESSAPRVCFEFSEPLARGRIDLAPFVTVSGASNGAISVEDQQLCAEGLKHGEPYAIQLRQGLRSVTGETLTKTADYEIYVRDRSPHVHFTGRNYVLPRAGQEGIPVLSVNTHKVAVGILRIGDRNLLSTLRSDDFLAQLYPYRLKQLTDTDASKIWSGTLDVKPELNQDVVTAFPVQDAVGHLEPGVYVMTASPAEDGTAPEGAENYGEAAATQWFIVSDLGLSAFSGPDGIHVLVRSLASAAPRPANLRLIARDNEVLATTTAGSDGHAHFDPGLARGTGGLAAALVVAEDGKGDYGFLDLAQGAFDLTDRGVKGRDPAKALDALVFAERGVYRSGETVFITTLLRNSDGIAHPGLPVTLVVKRPDGVEYKRVRVEDQGQGGRALPLPLLSGVSPGTWRIEAFADPKAEPIGTTSFLVEDYIPERLDLKLEPAAKAVRAGQAIEMTATARYLYGAPGANLEITGTVEIHAAERAPLPALEGYVAGLTDEDFEPVSQEIEAAAATDAKGVAKLLAPIPEVSAARPLEARILVQAGEPGGHAIERSLSVPILPQGGLIGVKKNFARLTDGAEARFDVIAVGRDGTRTTRKGVKWSLYQIGNDYQWFRADGRWSFEQVKSSRRVAEGTIDIGADAPGKIAAIVGLGQYRLDLASPNASDLPTSLAFESGWSGEASAATPDLLDVSLDKADYAPGDNLKLAIKSRFAGTATIAVIGDKLKTIEVLDLKEGETIKTLPVKAEWGASAYAVVLAHRPLDKAAHRMPGRAIGLAWFTVDAAAHRLEVKLDAPEKARPRGPLTIPIGIKGLAAGEEAYVTLAAVDTGILNLTDYHWPNANEFFFGQRRLSAELRDLYGFLIDGMQGTRGAIHSGGDAGASLSAERPTNEPVALYSGIVKLAPDGTARVSFEVPAFSGALRVMASAWSKSKTGSGEAEVVVRDPVVVQATLPRFLALRDKARLHLAIDNVEGPAGDYALDLAVEGGLTLPADQLHRKIKLDAKARQDVAIPIEASGIGRANLAIKLEGRGMSTEQSLALDVSPGTSSLYRRFMRSIAPSASLTVSNDLLADFIPGTGAVSLAVSELSGVDVPALLQALDRYPYGCTEQVVSRALPLLYVNKLAEAARLGIDPDVEGRVREAIERVLARQGSSGSFGAWSAQDTDDMWLHAYATDFLTRARENHFAVPRKAFDLALERLRNLVANSGEIGTGQAAPIAYAAYVLARNGRPVMGDLRYLADTKLDRFDTPLSRAQLAAALALLGDRTRAADVFAKASELLSTSVNPLFSRVDYGSRLRDGAGLLALAVETDMPNAEILRAERIIEDARTKTSLTSTQENAFLTLAAEALAGRTETLSLSIDGTAHQGALYRTYDAQALDAQSISIGNKGEAPIRAVLTTSGNPLVPEPEASQGYRIERIYYSLAGKRIEPDAIKQNDRLVVALTITETEAAYARLLLVDPLPAGLEIDNPVLYEGGSTGALAWLSGNIQPIHAEYRDDRFVAAFQRSGQEQATFSVAYVARAVTPGYYARPAAFIEDMYRPERFGRTAFGSLEIAPAK
jgi:hypothetical protein